MNSQDTVRLIQAALGFPRSEIDGIPGRRTRGAISDLFTAALAERHAGLPLARHEGRVIERPGWSFRVLVENGDLIVQETTATWFGGDRDPLDNGETASGVLTRGHPDLLGCALPVLPHVRSTAGSPLPRLPWKTPVHVSVPGFPILVAPLIDNGPARSAGDGIDLTIAAFEQLGGTIAEGVIHGVSYRIPGAARYLA